MTSDTLGIAMESYNMNFAYASHVGRSCKVNLVLGPSGPRKLAVCLLVRLVAVSKVSHTQMWSI